MQQLKESSGGWVSQEKASVHYLGAEPFDPALSRAPALEDSSRRFFSNI
jgi:hypothetical protein